MSEVINSKLALYKSLSPLNYIGRETHVLKVVGSNPSMDIFHINML